MFGEIKRYKSPIRIRISWVCQYLKQLLVTLTKENINDVNLGYITIGKTELSALTGCRRVAYAISVHTQPLGMLAVI